jgi:phosphoribosylformylglycinamidine synthase subunit PurQ / glutaminase
MNLPKVLIICGNGLNCEEETAFAFRLSGAEPILVHFNDLIENNHLINDSQIIAFIGGFSYGDHLGAGAIQSYKFNEEFKELLWKAYEEEKPMIGICNGFQILMKMGLLPGLGCGQISLVPNDSGKFENRWVSLKINNQSKCIWTNNISRCELPVRHKEGKVISIDQDVLLRLEERGQLVIQYINPNQRSVTQEYPWNPNGSMYGVAGICDPTGRIFGLMPHPEGYLHPYNHPTWTRKVALDMPLSSKGEGVQFFKNAVEFVGSKCGVS